MTDKGCSTLDRGYGKIDKAGPLIPSEYIIVHFKKYRMFIAHFSQGIERLHTHINRRFVLYIIVWTLYYWLLKRHFTECGMWPWRPFTWLLYGYPIIPFKPVCLLKDQMQTDFSYTIHQLFKKSLGDLNKNDKVPAVATRRQATCAVRCPRVP